MKARIVLYNQLCFQDLFLNESYTSQGVRGRGGCHIIQLQSSQIGSEQNCQCLITLMAAVS